MTQHIFYFNEGTASVFVCTFCEAVASHYSPSGGGNGSDSVSTHNLIRIRRRS